ncbi:aminotransferase class V-fold PLP-dependent enzyme [Persicobacter psychrovividus]|uniref:phosphoserine transaminase n=1 Tax=Persicobacter psychrovividus TaxID=387638 RepID=A0ABN6L7V1_9BACT|nr:phosphoserine aminotransferase [Persicobacter psychrovividus]
MPQLIFVPGPSATYFTLEDHLKSALKEQVMAISHRSPAFKGIYKFTVEQLRQLLDIPQAYEVVFTTSATEVWDRMAENLVDTHSLHHVHGAFSKKCAQAFQRLGKEAQMITAPEGTVALFDPKAVEAQPELIHFTANETATGVKHPMADLREAKKHFPDALIAMDVVSSTPTTPIPFEDLDSVYFSVQKCFGLPAGLGVWIVSPRAIAKAHALTVAGKVYPSYHPLLEMVDKGKGYQTIETPNTLNIYLLGKVAEDFRRKGVDVIRREAIYKNTILIKCFEDHPLLSPLVQEKDWRSDTVAVANVEGGSAPLIAYLKEKGLVVGAGYGKHKAAQIRIANFPTHSKEQIELLVDLIADWRP